MIYPKDLMIGNLLHDKEVNEVAAAMTVDDENILLNYDGAWRMQRLDNLRGIYVTPEWLLKLGFKNFGTDCYVLGHIKFFVNQLPKGATGHDSYVQFKSSSIGCVPEVHRLQNLVYVLTGKELTVKEKA